MVTVALKAMRLPPRDQACLSGRVPQAPSQVPIQLTKTEVEAGPQLIRRLGAALIILVAFLLSIPIIANLVGPSGNWTPLAVFWAVVLVASFLVRGRGKPRPPGQPRKLSARYIAALVLTLIWVAVLIGRALRLY